VTPAEVAAILERQVQQLDDLEHTVADLLTGQGAAGSAVVDGPAAPFRWSSLPEFVEHVIAPLYVAHLVSGGGWCEQWYEHVEARIRFGAVGGPGRRCALTRTWAWLGGCVTSRTRRWTGCGDRAARFGLVVTGTWFLLHCRCVRPRPRSGLN